MTILLDNVNVTQLNHSREVDQHETMLDAEVLDLFGPEPETSSPFLVNYPLESGHTKDRPLLEHTTRLNGNFSFRAHTNQNGSSSDTAEHDVPNEEWEIPMQSMSSPSGNVDSAQDYYSDYQSGQSSVHEPQKCAGTENVIPPNWLEMNDLCEGDLSRWSCNQRCSQFGDWDFFGFTCSCHPNCVMHNFCCSDFETECPQEFQEAMNARKKFPDTSASCDPVLGSHVISTCPAGASEVEKTLCEGDWEVSLDLEKEVTLEDHTFTNSSATAILRETRRPNQAVERLKREAPVSDPVLGWHFKNRFCWRCWKMKNPPVMWRIDILISAESRPAEDYRLDTMTDYAEHHRDMISWHPPPPLVRLPCSSLFKEKVQLYEDVTAWCTACQVDQVTQEACVNGSASYLRIGAELYKNHHCFLCSKFYHSEKLSSPQNHDHLLPVTIESEQKHFCYTVEFFNDLAYHNMYFPVTMILPDEHNGGVEFIQKADHFGAFTWDKLQCKNTGTESEDPSCVAEKCSDTALLVNDKCDNSYYPRKAIIRICVTDPENDHISCQPNQQETTGLQDEEKDHGHNHREASLSIVTFKKRFGTDLEQVREKFVIMGSHFGAKHFGNFSLMQASIEDDPREGLLVFRVENEKGRIRIRI
ncbi:hypothetical protein RRG08_040600 [Elysia crispata]|uniref:SMB domain-containing protein n=1 Tax=Elysia crispata TaxID=231223 RepID=A0AAE1D002_9GAST|nr:hypothetical protein RRG08_040600 [Elysia crispata]